MIYIFFNFQLEIIGLNRENYETRRRVVHVNVQEKPGKETECVIFHPKCDTNTLQSGVCNACIVCTFR
jgi:hypothetical protein